MRVAALQLCGQEPVGRADLGLSIAPSGSLTTSPDVALLAFAASSPSGDDLAGPTTSATPARRSYSAGSSEASRVGASPRLGAGRQPGRPRRVYPARRLRRPTRRARSRPTDSAHWSRMHLTSIPEPPPVEGVDVLPKVVRQRGLTLLSARRQACWRNSGSWDAGSVCVGGRVAVGARGARRRPGAVAVHHRDPRRPEPDDHLPPGALRRRRVPVPAVDADLALLVGARPPVLDTRTGEAGSASIAARSSSNSSSSGRPFL